MFQVSLQRGIFDNISVNFHTFDGGTAAQICSVSFSIEEVKISLMSSINYVVHFDQIQGNQRDSLIEAMTYLGFSVDNDMFYNTNNQEYFADHGFEVTRIENITCNNPGEHYIDPAGDMQHWHVEQ